MGRKPLSESNENADDAKKKSAKKEPAQSLAQRFLAKTKIDGLQLAATLDQSKMSNISEWVSTGSFALNRIISGSYYRGLPRGRIVALAGSSGVGKSFICGNCIREAQKQGYTVLVFDSENAIDKEFLERIGVNVADVIHIPVSTIHEVKIKATLMMREFRADYPEGKLFIVIDSIGALLTEKEFNDQIENNNTAMDMGLRAKQLRVLSKILTAEVALSQAVMLVTNHTYEQAAANPQAAPTIKMGGGEGFIYATSAIIYLKKSLEKEEGENLATGKTEKQIKGAILKAHTEKNRFIPQGAKGEIYISFSQGVNRWYGMLEDAMEFDMVKVESQGWYTLPGGNKIRKKDLYKSEVWKPMLDELNTKVEGKYKFATFKDADDISNELDNTSDEDGTESDPNS
jgi:recombination protein RecA